MAGESVYRLEPLSVPATTQLTPALAIEHGAVALLCKRVADADRRFRLSEDNLAAVVSLCDRLDGLPLAIEMAAPRVAAIGIEAVHGLLGERLKLSAQQGRAGRHASLRETYAWSCGLLSPVEQAVFRRLEPFLGGFVAETAQQVARDDDEGGTIGPWEVLDALGTLVDKSLVQRGSDGSGRFHLLESARDHARDCLQAAGELARVQQRHAQATAQRLATAQADAALLNDKAWLQRHGSESHNARVALAWCIAHGAADDLARLVTALALMDWMRCRQADILSADIPLGVLAQAAPRLRADACLEYSWALFSDGDHQLGAQLAQEAQALYEALDEPALAYRALAQWTRLLETLPGMEVQAQQAWQQMLVRQSVPMPRRIRLFCAVSGGLVNRPEMSAERLEALGREAEHEGFDGIAAIAACNRTDILLVAGRDDEVVAATDRALARHAGAHRACACMLLNRSTALIRLGRLDDARAAAHLAMRLMPAVAPALVDAFAWAAARAQRLADAAVLHGCGNHVRARLSHAPDRAEAEGIRDTQARLRDGLPAAALQELMALGAAMAPHEAPGHQGVRAGTDSHGRACSMACRSSVFSRFDASQLSSASACSGVQPPRLHSRAWMRSGVRSPNHCAPRAATTARPAGSAMPSSSPCTASAWRRLTSASVTGNHGGSGKCSRQSSSSVKSSKHWNIACTAPQPRMPSPRSSWARMAPRLDTPQTCQPASRAVHSSAWPTASADWNTPSQRIITPGAPAVSTSCCTSPRRTGGARRTPAAVNSGGAMPCVDGPANSTGAVASSVCGCMAVGQRQQPASDALERRVGFLAAGHDDLHHLQAVQSGVEVVAQHRAKAQLRQALQQVRQQIVQRPPLHRHRRHRLPGDAAAAVERLAPGQRLAHIALVALGCERGIEAGQVVAPAVDAAQPRLRRLADRTLQRDAGIQVQAGAFGQVHRLVAAVLGQQGLEAGQTKFVGYVAQRQVDAHRRPGPGQRRHRRRAVVRVHPCRVVLRQVHGQCVALQHLQQAVQRGLGQRVARGQPVAGPAEQRRTVRIGEGQEHQLGGQPDRCAAGQVVTGQV